MITVFAEFGGIANAAPLLGIEKGGVCFGEPTVTCKSPLPVLPIVTVALAVALGTALKFKLRGETVIRPCSMGVRIAVGLAVGVSVAVDVAVAMEVVVGVDFALAVVVADAFGVSVVVAVAVRVLVVAVADGVAVEVRVAVAVAVDVGRGVPIYALANSSMSTLPHPVTRS